MSISLGKSVKQSDAAHLQDQGINVFVSGMP